MCFRHDPSEPTWESINMYELMNYEGCCFEAFDSMGWLWVHHWFNISQLHRSRRLELVDLKAWPQTGEVRAINWGFVAVTYDVYIKN